jgi:hypothetical protein
MASVIDFSQPPERVLVDLIKDANPAINLKVSDVEFDLPQVTTGGDALLRNTKLTIRAKDSGNFVGLVDVLYDRVNLTEAIAQDAGHVIQTRDTDLTMRDLIDLINENWAIRLKRSDIVDLPLPNIFGDTPVTLQTSITSLVFYGSTSVLVHRTQPLSVAISDPVLAGLELTADNPDVTTEDQLFALMNAQNHLAAFPFSPERVSFSGLAESSGGEFFNTLLTVTAVPEHGFVGSADIYYNRLNLTTILADGVVGFYSDVPVDGEMLVTKFNEALGSFLTLEDLQPIIIPAMTPFQTYAITLTAKSTSTGWIGSGQIEVMMGIPDDAQGLHALIQTTLPTSLG